MKLRRSPKGFTLIELLVVISIIAVLASLAVPAVTGALVKGQLIQALSNGRQIHQATMAMAIDGATNSDSSLGWPGDLYNADAANKITNLSDFVTRLVANDYFKPGDLKIFSTAGITSYPGGTITGTPATLGTPFTDKHSAYKVYLVHETDPSNTIFLATKNYTYNTAFDTTNSNLRPFGDKGFVVIRKGGDGSSLKKNNASGTNVVNIVGNVPLTTGDPSIAGTESPTNCFQTAQ